MNTVMELAQKSSKKEVSFVMKNDANKNVMRKLRPEEAERVCGGVNLGPTPVAPDDFAPLFCGEPMNAHTCCEVLGGIYDTFGEDYAIEYAKNYMIPTSDWHDYCKEGGIYYAVDMIYGKLYLSYSTGEPAY